MVTARPQAETAASAAVAGPEVLGQGDGREDFIARDYEDFVRRYPRVDLRELDADSAFHRFCGSRYGKEPLAQLYEDWVALSRSAEERVQARSRSKESRATGSGSGSAADSGLTAAQQRSLEEWNRAFPHMRMTAKEFAQR